MKRLMEKYHLLNNLRTDLLTLTRESYIYFQGLGKHVYDDAIKAGFSGRDFEMYLTDSKEDNIKYYLGAFYTNAEIEKGKAILDRWNKFVASKV